MKASLRRRPICLIAAAVAIAAWIGCRTSRTTTVDPLPAVAEARSVTARFFDPDAGRDVQFDVPLDRLSSIYQALLPATVDEQPADWMVLGELEMTLRDGRPFRIDLYHLRPGEEGAFSAGETYERRTYYRGGSSPRLVEALREAHAAARARTPIQPQGAPR